MIRDPQNWTMPPRPAALRLTGQYIDLVPWDASRHGQSLWKNLGAKETNQFLFHFGWPQMDSWDDLAAILDEFNQSGAFVTHMFADKNTGEALGMASYMAIVPEHGRVEIGCVAHGAKLQNSPAATEAHYLLARHIFDELGYRRYEWKLNNSNKASHRAAKRLGFSYEGLFRQHQVMTYGNRDTAWYSILDREWPRLKRTLEAWLEPNNFEASGVQKQSLKQLRELMS